MVPADSSAVVAAFERAQARLREGISPGDGCRFGRAGRLAHSAIFRVLRPYTAAQLDLQRDVLTELRAAVLAGDPAGEGRFPELVEMERRDAENMHRLLAAVLKADSNVIDVGAHGGAFLREAISFAPDGQHIALEPLPHLAARLEEDFPQVDVYCTAASDRVGTASFFHAVDVEPWSGLKSRPLPDGKDPVTEEIEVTLTPIDQLLPEGYRVDLLKIDVEGAEEQVLNGAKTTIQEQRPVVIFEHGIGSADVFGTTPQDIHNFFTESAGMRIFDLAGGGPYSLDMFVDAFFTNAHVNFVAHE